jgi:hypothetical protein
MLVIRLVEMLKKYQLYINNDRHISQCAYYNRYTYITKLQFRDENLAGLFRSDHEILTLVYRQMELHQTGWEIKGCNSTCFEILRCIRL